MDNKTFEEIYAAPRGGGRVVQYKENIKWMIENAEKTQGKVIIEIGVETGGTLAFWSQIVGDDGLVIGVDINENTMREIVIPAYKNLSQEVHIVVGDSMLDETEEKVKTALNGREADFLFIDANHDFAHVSNDFNRFSKYVKNGGLVGFDDIGDSEPFFTNLQGRKESMGRNAIFWINR